VEDLQDQLDQKNYNEKELSIEKSKLEACMEAESRTSARKSLEVEQLKWKIRHNMDLPSALMHQPMSCPTQDLSPDGLAQWNSGAKERPQSAPTSVRIQEDDDSSMNGLGDVNEEYENGMIDLANSQNKRCEIIYDNMSTVRQSVSHFEKMISSESRKTSIIDVEEKEADSTETVTSYDIFNGAVDDASDEGLGDISSENDSGSPQPNQDNKEEKEVEIFKCAKKFDKTQPFLDLSADNDIVNNKQKEQKLSSPAEERLPSRMPFETPL